jgi:thiol-disulfide isomerase/thioredoxin|tara:strand:+ start:337 stop:708 length:372 start_codon:yes stop_codon:yes gene_type:complete
MPVNRISKEAIMKMRRGQVNVPDQTTCVIKFYSNGCHLCHALSSYYKDISDSYDDVMFFAYNVDDDEEISDMLNLNGVPSITMFKVKQGKKAVIRNLADPDNPNEETWFTSNQIKNFIDKELK